VRQPPAGSEIRFDGSIERREGPLPLVIPLSSRSWRHRFDRRDAMQDAEELSYYASPGPLTRLDERPQLARLPADPAGIVRVVQGLMVHDYYAPLYGLDVPPERRRVEHELRTADAIVHQILRLDPASLTEPRPPERRLIGYCRHFSVLTCALLRHVGVPARARCGFGMSFESGRGIDHWILERWDEDRGGWVRTDAQLDDIQRRALGLQFDPLVLPAGVFLSGGEAWQRCRAGQADPAKFGIGEWWGAWFVRNNVVRDVAALNKVELLPWDSWGLMDRESNLGEGSADELVDEVASLAADDRWAALRAKYEGDLRLRAPASGYQTPPAGS
jgi:hypothetical protein